MKIGKTSKGLLVGVGVFMVSAYLAVCGTINQSGGSGTTYTDQLSDSQGSANLLRDLSFVTVANDANNLYFTIGINPAGNLATGGAFNYVIGITPGNPNAGGDTSASADHGNPYSRAISFDSSFGGMTDFVGIFGAGGSGSGSSPYTSYGLNDFYYTPGSTPTNGVWTKVETVSSGQPLSDQPSTSIPNQVTITVPMSDFAANLTLMPGTSFDFDVCSTGTSAGQTAYDSLALQTVVQPGVPPGTSGSGYSSTYQFNETVLDQYTVTAVPEPVTWAFTGLTGLSIILLHRRGK